MYRVISKEFHVRLSRKFVIRFLRLRGYAVSMELCYCAFVIPTKRQNVCPQMRKLAAQIRRELRESSLLIPYCAVYEEDLQRLFPLELKNREVEIEGFARQHGFRLRFYKRGLCAIFQENPARNHKRR